MPTLQIYGGTLNDWIIAGGGSPSATCSTLGWPSPRVTVGLSTSWASAHPGRWAGRIDKILPPSAPGKMTRWRRFCVNRGTVTVGSSSPGTKKT